MYARIRKAREEGEGGFTLIELLVVMIIIGILAAVAIPVFLRQRENGYNTATKSDLKNSAEALESAAVDTEGEFDLPTAAGVPQAAAGDLIWDDGAAGLTPALVEFNGSKNTTITLTTVSGTTYCLTGTHAKTGDTYSYDKVNGTVESGANC